MKAVFNTSPLCYLILIEQIDILPSLFDEIVIPEAVVTELLHSGAPAAVAKWANDEDRGRIGRHGADSFHAEYIGRACKAFGH